MKNHHVPIKSILQTFLSSPFKFLGSYYFTYDRYTGAAALLFQLI